MKVGLLSIIALAASALFPPLLPQDPLADSQTPKQQGIAYVSWQAGQYSQPDADLALANLRATGANWISLLVTQYQDTTTSTNIYTTTATPLDADLIHVIGQAHSLGLKVMLKPHVDLANDAAHWRGQIGQGFSEAQWTSWFGSYQAVIAHYAQLAQAYGVDQFCVGTELSATQSRGAQWRAVITSTRSFFNGPITYAANSGDEGGVNWWDAVDLIGIDAYYPLTTKTNPTVAELTAGWAPYTTSLSSLASTWGRKILFTEIGYRSQDGANQHPWDYQVGGAIDLQEQSDAYEAAFASVVNQPWFAGMYWWSWGTNPFEGGSCDDGYSPHDKPAEDFLRSWYGGSPRSRSSAPEPNPVEALIIYTDTLASGWGDWSYGSAVNRFTVSPVYSGTQAISVTIQPWGALSLHHANLDTSSYYWLEFYIRVATSGQTLRALANDQADSELRYVSVCNYLDSTGFAPQVWERARIPLRDMNAMNRPIQRVTIKNIGSQPIQLWIDEMKLTRATWRASMPILER